MNRIVIFLATLLISISLFACGKQKSGIEYLKGKWVKEDNERDTLYFIDASSFILTLEHVTTPPKDPEGMYSYSLSDTGIIVHWVFANSNNPGKADYFNLDNSHQTLVIGNFYNAPNSGKQLAFKKIE